MINVENANLLQIAAYLETGEPSAPALENRLGEIHELTRWIPVSERMPAEEDANPDGFVQFWNAYTEMPETNLFDANLTSLDVRYTHWQAHHPTGDPMTLYTHYDLDKHTSRKFRYKEYRHAVRHVLARHHKNYQVVRLMEYADTGKKPHHTTIMHSVEVADPRLVAIVAKTARALRIFR